MNRDENDGLKGILELRSIIEKVYFRGFVANIDFPIKLNHTLIKTLMILNFEGAKPMSMISDKMNLEKGSFTPIAGNLIQYGFVEKIPDEKDKRVFNLQLTEKGKTFSVEFCDKYNAYMKELLEGISENEKELYFSAIQMVNQLTRKIQDNIDKD